MPGTLFKSNTSIIWWGNHWKEKEKGKTCRESKEDSISGPYHQQSNTVILKSIFNQMSVTSWVAEVTVPDQLLVHCKDFFFNYCFKYYTVPLFACKDMVSSIYMKRTGELSLLQYKDANVYFVTKTDLDVCAEIHSSLPNATSFAKYQHPPLYQ